MSRKELRELEEQFTERLAKNGIRKGEGYISISVDNGYSVHGLPETKIDVIVNPENPNIEIMDIIRNEIMDIVFSKNVELEEEQQIPYPFVRFYSPNKESYVY